MFVPGPGDPGPGAVLPRPPLPEAVTKRLREVVPGAVFATNPCRLRYGSQELLLLRDDLQKRLRRLCLRDPVEGGVHASRLEVDALSHPTCGRSTEHRGIPASLPASRD